MFYVNLFNPQITKVLIESLHYETNRDVRNLILRLYGKMGAINKNKRKQIYKFCRKDGPSSTAQFYFNFINSQHKMNLLGDLKNII